MHACLLRGGREAFLIPALGGVWQRGQTHVYS